MTSTVLEIHKSQHSRLATALKMLCEEIDGKALLTASNGQLLAVSDNMGEIDSTSIASLAASCIAVTNELSRLIGDEELPSLTHVGNQHTIHLTVLRGSVLLLIFDERFSLQFVKNRIKAVSDEIGEILSEILSGKTPPDADRSTLATPITKHDLKDIFQE